MAGVGAEQEQGVPVAERNTTTEPETELAGLDRKIRREMGRAIEEFGLIREGDRILAAVSGGKDSLCMLHFLEEFRKRAPVHFTVLAVNLDQGQPGFPDHLLPQLFRDWGVDFHIEKEDTYSIVVERRRPARPSAPCARDYDAESSIVWRRDHNCNKLALGHHRDDLLATS